MNIPEIASYVCARSPTLTKKEALNVVKTTFEVIADSLEKGESVTLSNFGKFETVRAGEKKAQDFCGGTVSVPPHHRVRFRAAKALKNKVNGITR